jgi:hypothetical protein
MSDDLRELMICGHPKACEQSLKGFTPQVLFACAACEREAAAVEAAREECAALIGRYLSTYPPDIFIEPPRGQHGTTVDSCSARALRGVLPNIAFDIRGLSVTGALALRIAQARLSTLKAILAFMHDHCYVGMSGDPDDVEFHEDVLDGELREQIAELEATPKP